MHRFHKLITTDATIIKRAIKTQPIYSMISTRLLSATREKQEVRMTIVIATD